MRYDNRNYPHPVMGVGTDIEGSFYAHLTVKSDSEMTTLKPKLTLKNATLEKLIESKEATYSMQLYCKGTMFRESFTITDPLSYSCEIPTESLSGECEIDFFICAEKNIKEYKNTSANEIFGNTTFSIEKGYILAYGGKGKFFANKSPEKLKSISSFMRIKNGGFNSGPFNLDYSEDKFITIELSNQDYETYFLLKSNSQYWNILHMGIVFPALIEVANQIQNENSGLEDMSDARWYVLFKNLLDVAKGNSLFEKVQNILDLPLNRAFIDLEPED